MEKFKNQNSEVGRNKRGFKGMILDGKVYIAVRDRQYYRICERCDVSGTGLCDRDTLGTMICNAFTEHFHIPVRFRFCQQLTEALASLKCN